MREYKATRRRVCVTVLTAVLLAACNSNENARVEETRRQLVGTWVEETAQGAARWRDVLTLTPEGKFTHAATKDVPGAPTERHDYAGEWSYDGVNLKRRYLQEDGRQFAGGSMRYATTPLKSVSQTELVIDDTLNRREARYRRAKG